MNPCRAVGVTGMAAPALAAAVAGGLDGWAQLGSALSATVPGPAVVALAQVIAAACGCWLTTGALLTMIGEVPGAGCALARRVAELSTPRCWRTAVLTVVGAGVLGGPTLAAASMPSVPSVPSVPRVSLDDPGAHTAPAARVDASSGLEALDGLVLPDRPSGGWPPVAGRQRVVVRPGDTLWAISAGALPEGSDVAAVARSCARWYHANAAVIGPDPDLLLPGTRLRAPLPAPWTPSPADARCL